MRKLCRVLGEALDVDPRLDARAIYPIFHAMCRAVSSTGGLAIEVARYRYADLAGAILWGLLDGARTANDVVIARRELERTMEEISLTPLERVAVGDVQRRAVDCLAELIAALARHEQGPHAGCDIAMLSVPHIHTATVPQ